MDQSHHDQPVQAEPRRRGRWTWWLASLFVFAGLVYGGWQVWFAQQAYYTDADTIKRPVATVTLRDVLWQPPRQLSELINTAHDDYEPRPSADGQMLYLVRGKAGENADIFVSEHTASGWTEAEPLTRVNSPHDDLGPEPSADGKALFFYSNRPGGSGGYDLWLAEKGQGGWQTPINLGPLVNSEFNDYGPALAPDGVTLFFASNRPSPEEASGPDPDAWPATLREDLYHRDYDLYVASRTDKGFSKAAPIEVLNTPHNEGSPCVSPFGDFLYFSSDRTGGIGGYDLYRTWLRHSEPQTPSNLGTGVNTPANELDPGLALGGYALYFSSDYPATRTDPHKPNDYNLYYTTSREVFQEFEALEGAGNWAGLWKKLLPNLLWLLLALLLALLLTYLLRGEAYRKLSLLARCLLISLLMHMLALFLMSLWNVSTEIAQALRRGGGLQVALVSPAGASDIARQIRGELTLFALPNTSIEPLERQIPRIEPQSSSAHALLAVPSRPVRLQEHLQITVDIAEAPRPEQVDRALPDAKASLPELENAIEVNVATPPVASRRAQQEPQLPTQAIPVEIAQVQNSLSENSPWRPTGALVTLEPAGRVFSEGTASPANLPKQAEARESVPRASELFESRFDVDQVAPSSRLDVNLPGSGPAMSRPSVDTEPALRIEPRTSAAADRPVERDPNHLSNFASIQLRQLATKALPSDAVPVFRPEAHEVAESPSPSPHALSQPVETQVTIPNIDAASLPLPLLEDSVLGPSSEVVLEPQELLADERITNRLGGATQQDAVESTAVALAPDRAMKSLEDEQTLAMLPHDIGELSLPGTRGDREENSPLLAAVALPELPGLDLDIPRDTKILPNPFAQRQEQHREALVKRGGGSEKTEQAVALALKWLAAHQSADGHWDARKYDENCGACRGKTKIKADVALTGLSLLCFLAVDHTHLKEGEYQDTVKLGLDWLVGQQRLDGDLRNGETMYSHGIASLALSEAYGMTADPELADAGRRAIDFIYRARNTSDGGWRYDPGQVGDTSVLGWQVMALKSAEASGIEVPEAALDVAGRWLERVSRGPVGGLYAYQPGRKHSRSMTAEAMFVQQLLGHSADEVRMRTSARYIIKELPDWEDNPNTYLWYYATLALFQHQGEEWALWNQAVIEQLLTHQRRSGKAAGSWDSTDCWSKLGGRVYQTALCTLILEVYYRYLPLYMQPAVNQDKVSEM